MIIKINSNFTIYSKPGNLERFYTSGLSRAQLSIFPRKSQFGYNLMNSKFLVNCDIIMRTADVLNNSYSDHDDQARNSPS